MKNKNKSIMIPILNFLLSIVSSYLLLTIDKASPFYIQSPDLWYIFLPFFIMSILSGVIAFLMIVQINYHFAYGFWSILIQIVLTLILVNVILGNLSSGSTKLRISIILLLCLSLYYMSIVFKNVFQNKGDYRSK